ncbi:lactam utilization protein LamB [Moraxella caviae]|uniref:5-oxoprolinase subunit A n=1 Tax=Moraxella caviae TaxID=34060 RepID=A0A1S9ZW20_9GAMM|nr:5-oxoprolinase subunit PxpA [Moraxella caviae]OOR87722.1 lactam utilization protein LamB [Moraxella caviae]STZ10132.1 LamB/YcsF family protein [Moraxella caviae]VEW11098.1 LamB/YcsF family protein [Moraxella caviae]
MKTSIDLNADVAEGFAFDEALMGIISSANISAGLHAGGAATMAQTLQFAKAHGVRIGAHPSYDDRANFGRTNCNLSADEVRALLFYQLGAVKAVCQSMGLTVSYVKPHGALYNQASSDRTLADTIANTIKEFDPTLALMGLSGGELIKAGKAAGLTTISEVFADRRYEPDGTLVSRTKPNALIDNDDEAINQVLMMVQKGQVIATDGSVVNLDVDSICLHGDGEHALVFAQKIKQTLQAHGIDIKAS